MWDARYVDEQGYILVNRNSGLVVAVSGGSNDNGAPIIQWPWGNQPEQVWGLQCIPASCHD